MLSGFIVEFSDLTAPTLSSGEPRYPVTPSPTLSHRHMDRREIRHGGYGASQWTAASTDTGHLMSMGSSLAKR